MATTAVAFGKVSTVTKITYIPNLIDDFTFSMQLHIYQQKGKPIPRGWALDSDGGPVTDPAVALKSQLLMPLGGEEINSGHKGFGLAMMVEIFCSLLGGSTFSGSIRKLGEERPGDYGQSFVALDPECFAPDFKKRMQEFLCSIKATKPVRIE